jgi:hypothetical protein
VVFGAETTPTTATPRILVETGTGSSPQSPTNTNAPITQSSIALFVVAGVAVGLCLIIIIGNSIRKRQSVTRWRNTKNKAPFADETLTRLRVDENKRYRAWPKIKL